MQVPVGFESSGSLQISKLPLGYKALTVFIGVVLIVAWLAFFGLMTANPTADGEGPLFAVMGVIAVLTVVGVLFWIIDSFLFSAWVEGETLFVRHVSGTRKWSLSAAVVDARAVSRAVTLRIKDPVSGRRVRVRVEGAGLRNAYAMARAITAGRPEDPAARVAADSLVRVAAKVYGPR